jgi:hypothetical protein
MKKTSAISLFDNMKKKVLQLSYQCSTLGTYHVNPPPSLYAFLGNYLCKWVDIKSLGGYLLSS